MKTILFFIALAASAITKAQINSVSLQASGLTCSMCSNAINKALKSLDFVQQVDPDIKTYTFQISFKPNSIVDFDMLRKKVENAGFAVCDFVANIHFNNLHVKNGGPIIIQNNTLLFPNVTDLILNGNKRIRILDKGFVSPKEYKKYASLVTYPQTYHVAL